MEAGGDVEVEVRRLRHEVDALNGQLRALLAALGSLPVLVLVALSLFGGAYTELDEDAEEIDGADALSLTDLPGQAADFDNGAVQVLAVLTILALVGLAAASLVVLATRRTTPALAAFGAVALLLLILLVVVGASGGDGAIGDLGASAAPGAWWPLAAVVWSGAGCWLVRRTH